MHSRRHPPQDTGNDPEQFQPSRRIAPGTLARELWDLEPGEFISRPESNTFRRAVARAIEVVTSRNSQRSYESDLWFAMHHSGRGQNKRLLIVERKA